ncbi:uncharacterized protein B4U80_00945, partial [Leptotrombidium deliense]
IQIVEECDSVLWKVKVPEELKVYYAKRNELSIEASMILWGHRVVIPHKLKERILKELHVGHFGATKMKQIARSRFWWPSIDKEIERMVNSCSSCGSQHNDPPKEKQHKWEITTKPWERIHLDFAGPFRGEMFLVIIDSYSKWCEVERMANDIRSESLQKS